MTRAEKIKLYGLGLVVANEQHWLELGYKIDYANDKLVKITQGA